MDNLSSTSSLPVTHNSSSCTSSSSGSCTCKSSSLPPPPPPPLNLCIVINICHYLTPLAKLIILAQPLESTSGEAERDAFLALQQILAVLDSGKNEPINVFPFFDKFCRYIGTTFSDFEEMDIFLVWDYLVKLITLVIPPLREIFMGRLSLSLDEHAWHSLTTRCVHSQFSQSVQSLEDFIKTTLSQFDKDYYNDIDLYQHRTSLESIKNFNAIILGRSPEILAFAVESAHLPSSLRFLDALSKNPSKLKPPSVIQFPASFNLSMRDGSIRKETEEETAGSVYDLAAVVTLEGQNCDVAQAYYRYVHEEGNQWFKGSGATHDLVDSTKAIQKNYFNTSDAKKVHPRLLIYAKRGISTILDQLRDYVTKGGQLRSKGDATFATAETPEHYDEAKQYYEEAIAHDASLRSVLQERLNSLEQIEKNQKAQSYENQADLSLGKRRFKEACDLYKLAMRSAVTNSSIYNRIREKEDYMMRIISLEIANHLTEKGEECLKSGSYAQSRENFAQALKLNPNYVHLQSIISGIDKLITQQTSAQKVSEANQAMKIGRYKYANQLFQEAVALVPERETALKPVLDSLVVLMQGEDALMKQRSGLIAMEDKKYAQAINLITEAITLLPPESITEHAFFLCDRAQVYFEMKDYQTSIVDCQAALELRPELAIAYLRLGSAQFELEHYDEALGSYEKAMRNDPSLSDQVKTKIRQVNTAKEVQQRKEREAERARVREEEQKRLEEKRAREEKLKKERLERQAQEQTEKLERTMMKEEEKRTRAVEQRPEQDAKPKQSKESLKERQKREKAEKELVKAQEKERQKIEKEKERERVRLEKEQKLREEQQAKEEELRRQREFAAEIEKAEAKLKEAEREKELEREKARIEREKLLAEREKAKSERKNNEKKPKNKDKSDQAKETTEAKPKTANPADPDFPSLGGVQLAAAGKKGADSYSTKAKNPAPPTKWSALLSTDEDTPKKASASQSAQTSQISKPKSSDYVDQFPTLSTTPTSEALPAESNKSVAVPAEPSQPSDPVLSSGELKALISKTINDMPNLHLPQSARSISDYSAASSAAHSQSSPFPEDAKTSLNSSRLTQNSVEKPPGISPSPMLSAKPPDPTSLTDLNFHLTGSGGDNSKTHGLQTHLNSNVLGLQGLPVSAEFQSSISRSQSKTFESSFLSQPFPSSLAHETDKPFSFSGLPSMEDAATFDHLGSSSFSRTAPMTALGATSLESMNGAGSYLSNDRGSSRLSSLFGKSSEMGLAGENPFLSNIMPFGSSNSNAIGNNNNGVFDGGAKDSLLGYSLDPYALNYSFDPSHQTNALHAAPLGADLDKVGFGLGLQGIDGSDGLFGPLGGSLPDSHSAGGESSRLQKLFSGFSDAQTSGEKGLGKTDLFGGIGSLDAQTFGGLTDSFHLPYSADPTASLLGATTIGGLWDGKPGASLSFSAASQLGGLSSVISLSLPKKLELPDLGKRLEDEVVNDFISFPSLAKLQRWNVQLFHWASAADGKEWAEYALFLPESVLSSLGSQTAVQSVASKCRCEIVFRELAWNSQKELFAIVSKDAFGTSVVLSLNHLLDSILIVLTQQLSASSSQAAPSVVSQADGRKEFSVADSVVDSLISSSSLAVEKDLLASPATSVSSSGPVPALSNSSLPSPAIAALPAPPVTASPSLPKGKAVTAAAVVAGKGKPTPSPAAPAAKLASSSPSAGPAPAPVPAPAPAPAPAANNAQTRRFLEIPSELIGLVIGHQGRKIKELATESGSKIQFKTSKTSEKEGKPGVLEISGTVDAVDKAVAMVAELLNSVGREYKEVSAQQAKAIRN